MLGRPMQVERAQRAFPATPLSAAAGAPPRRPSNIGGEATAASRNGSGAREGLSPTAPRLPIAGHATSGAASTQVTRL